MADRDKIPSGIPRNYKGLYKQVCEQQAPGAIAQSALRPLRHSVKALGNGPVEMISQVAAQLKPIAGNSLLREQVDWDEEHQKIDEFANKTTGDLDGIEWALMACHQVVSRLEFDDQIPDIGVEIYKQYLLNVHDAQFMERVTSSLQYDAEMDPETIEKHLTQISHHLKEEIQLFAKQLAKHGNVNSLRLSKKNKQPVDIHGGDIIQGIIV